DGDGDLDALVAGGSIQGGLRTWGYRTWWNNGAGRFDSWTSHASTGNRINGSALADIDGDGDLDAFLASFSASGNFHRLLRNDGAGNFASVAGLPPLPPQLSAGAFADVDRDGDRDLLVGAGFGTGSELLLLNDGTGTFVDATATHWAGGTPSGTLAFADVDRDGDPDAVLAVAFSTVSRPWVQIRLNDGTGHFSPGPTASMACAGVNVESIAVADFDEDGDPDLILGVQTGCASDPEVRRDMLLANDGTGRFTEAPALLSLPDEDGRATWDLATGDVDGDGDAEVLVALSKQDSPMWVLGAGEDALPVLPAQALEDAPHPALTRATDLARLGLVDRVAPYLAHQLVARDDAPTMRREIEQQVEFGRRQVDVAIVDGDLIATGIDRQRAKLHNRVGRRLDITARNRDQPFIRATLSESRHLDAFGVAAAEFTDVAADGVEQGTAALEIASAFDTARHTLADVLARTWLDQIVVRAQAQRFDRRRQTGVGCHQDDDGVCIHVLDPAHEFDPVEASGHTDVCQHNVKDLAAHNFQRFFAAGSFSHQVTDALQRLADGITDGGFIVNDENAGGFIIFHDQSSVVILLCQAIHSRCE
ncbi:MAG: VCBS repeat-containing protein, partial [Anaerolineae bacterium]|nr:VCBS repeat-containing protein [Anaerolineae bacterium]